MRLTLWLARGAIALLILFAALWYGATAHAEMPEWKRVPLDESTSGYRWECRDSAGTEPISRHNEDHSAIRDCARKTERHNRQFVLVPGFKIEFTPAGNPEEPPPVIVDPDPPETPLASFQAQASGLPQAWPLVASEAMSRDLGRLVFRFAPETITDAGQRMLHGENFGIWLWTNEIHGHVYTAEGERLLWRARGDWATPVEPGSQREVVFTWWSGGVGILIDGDLRLYVQGATAPRSAMFYGGIPASDKDGYNGTVDVRIYAEPEELDDVCWNADAWATVNHQPATPPGECLSDVTLKWMEPVGCADGQTFGSQKTDPVTGVVTKCGLLTDYQVYRNDEHVIDVPAPAHELVVTDHFRGDCYRMTARIGVIGSESSNEACR